MYMKTDSNPPNTQNKHINEYNYINSYQLNHYCISIFADKRVIIVQYIIVNINYMLCYIYTAGKTSIGTHHHFSQ